MNDDQRKSTQDRICEDISCGMSLAFVCTQDGMPTERAVYKWLASDDDFVHRYTRARENQMEFMSGEILAICDEEEDVNRARLKVDARKWLMARLAPKKYGDKQELKHTGDLKLMFDADDKDA